ncbi:MAG TPA: Csp1 family four helix bundle copper storage protein [Aquabacterium sp.]|uniref:Csp1 family four helix bundle copper storage protein n=1 Tax=Aquabacterium sp. TaxID=1872578 RepID=UPI002E361723|nr:Csp1 family four helix bundle copper storage protein [Aquabacterium sp.]HEX5355591.1 Csp1 family four helix bundle copper storage protein [Aquabacterium sp.]
MDRRQLMQRSTGLLALAAAVLPARTSAQESATHHHDHAAMLAARKGSKPKRFTGLIAPFQACTAAAAACIDHCQVLLSQGDKAMAACLRSALDCDVTCNAVLKAATLNSDFTPALARTAVDAMEACVKACKPHVDHHVECKNCHDACLAAIEAARKVA